MHVKKKDNIYILENIKNLKMELKKLEKLRKDKQKEISKILMETMKENEIDEFDINQGKIVYKKKNVKKPITKKNLMEILSKYYKGDLVSASNMNKFIMENRDEVVVETITRTMN